jgi:hypothetical protein
MICLDGKIPLKVYLINAFKSQTTDLRIVLLAHHATVFGERHLDELDPNHEEQKLQLIRYYQHIMENAQAACIRDIMIEAPPSAQNLKNENYKFYEDYVNRGEDFKKELLSFVLSGKVSAPNAILALSAIYGLTPHSVDVGDRQELDIYLYVTKQTQLYQSEHPNTSPAEFKNWFEENHLSECSDRMGRKMTLDEVLDIALKIEHNGIKETVSERIKNGDKKIAELMANKASGRAFIAIFGNRHGTDINENEAGFSEVDLDGALRLIYGSKHVAHVVLNQGVATKNEPNYLLNPDMKLHVFQPAPILEERSRVEFAKIHHLPIQWDAPIILATLARQMRSRRPDAIAEALHARGPDKGLRVK